MKALVVFLPILAVGCQQPQAPIEPIGRYVKVAEKRYSNGIEFFCLDTRTGQVASAFMTNEKVKTVQEVQALHDIDCAR